MSYTGVVRIPSPQSRRNAVNKNSDAKGDLNNNSCNEEVIASLLLKEHLSVDDLNYYMAKCNITRGNITHFLKGMNFLVNYGSQEKFNELICMISIGLSDVKVMGGKVSVNLDKITTFLKNETKLGKNLGYSDQHFKELGLKVCCACMHDKTHKQGESFTGTAEKILRANQIQYSESAINDLKLKIANGYHGQYNIFEVVYKFLPEQEICSNDFRVSGKNEGEFALFGEEIKYNYKYCVELANNLKTKILEVSQKVSLNKISNEKDIKPNAVEKLNFTSYHTIVDYIFYLNCFERKALNERAYTKYERSEKTTNNAANVSHHKVSITLGSIQKFFKNEIKIDITIQEAFILAALCAVKDESSQDLNKSAVKFIKALIPEEKWNTFNDIYLKTDAQRKIIELIKQDLSNGAITKKNFVQYFQVTNNQNNAQNEPSGVVEDEQQLNIVNNVHYPDNEVKVSDLLGEGAVNQMVNKQNNPSFNNDDKKKYLEENSQARAILAQSQAPQVPIPPAPPAFSAVAPEIPAPLVDNASLAKIKAQSQTPYVPVPPAPPVAPAIAASVANSKEVQQVKKPVSLLDEIKNGTKLRKVDPTDIEKRNAEDTRAKSLARNGLDSAQIKQFLARAKQMEPDAVLDDDEWK